MNTEIIARFLSGHYTDVISDHCLFLDLSNDLAITSKTDVLTYLSSHHELFERITLNEDNDESSASGTLLDGRWIKLTVRNHAITKIVLREATNLKRIRLIVAYDGTPFSGFQRQSNLPSVQQILEEALSSVHHRTIYVHGASRTDAGVHALAQVVHFDTDLAIEPVKWPMILNHLLPKAIRITGADSVSPLFHSRYDVERKEYRYILNLGDFSPFRRNYEWTVPYPLDLTVLRQELSKIEGTHDFFSFCKGEKDSTVRTIFETRCAVHDQQVILTFIGNGFLHHMIRLMVATLVDIASHRKNMDMTEIIEKKDRQLTKHLAPAEGLYLVSITY